jgi:hypothetical protein
VRLTSAPSNWLVATGSSLLVACSVYSTELLTYEDEIRRPDAGEPISSSSTAGSGSVTSANSTSSTGAPGSDSAAAGSSGSSPTNTAQPNTSSPSATGTPPDPDGGGPVATVEPDAGPTLPTNTPPSGSTSMAPLPSADPPPPAWLIEDFEDGKNPILKSGGRTGYWFTSADTAANDADGSITASTSLFVVPTSGGAYEASKKAAHVVAQGYDETTAHAEIGVNFLNPATGKPASAYPATADYVGVSFWAKIGADTYDDDASDDAQEIRFELPLTTTQTSYDHFGKSFFVTDEWAEYHVLWEDSSFYQVGFTPDTVVDFDAAEATGIQFKMSPETATGFDLWLDDIRFLEAEVASTADAGL